MGKDKELMELPQNLTRRHGLAMAMGTGLGLLAAASTVGLMTLSGWFISASALAGLAPTTAHAFNYFLPGVGLRLFALLRTACRYGERVLNHDATFRILETLRVRFYTGMEPLAPGDLRLFRRGDILHRAVADIDTLDQVYLRILSPSVVALLTCLLSFGILAIFHLPAAFYTLGLLMLAACTTSLFTTKKGMSMGEELTRQWTNLRTRLVEGLQGMAELTVFGGVRGHRSAILHCHTSLVDCQRKMASVRGAATAAIHIFAGIAILSLLMVISGEVAEERPAGAITAGLVLMVLASFDAVFPLPSAYLMVGRVREAALRLRELLEIPVAVQFPPQNLAEPSNFSVRFQNVSFSYGPEQPQVLDGITLHIPQGQRTAVIGESGAGKSSLAHLLVRFFDAAEGRISLGGVDIRSLSEESLRRHVVTLSQEAHLFAATIRENLLLGQPEAKEEDLLRALNTARLGSFVEKLPKGLDTWLGESGQLISAGQARRVTLARAILRDAPIWVLDEPTEGLDRKTERKLVDSLMQVTRYRTVLWITHRLTDLHLMDRVIFLEGGRIVAQGRHLELMAENPRYRSWCNRVSCSDQEGIRL